MLFFMFYICFYWDWF